MGRTGSAEHRLLVLGLLRMQEMHGYQLAETVEAHTGDNALIKKSTLYDTLRKLDASGSVTSLNEQEGNRPPRKVYALTPEGEQEFLALLRESISTYRDPDLRDESALMFLNALEPDEVRSLLASRKASMAAALDDRPADDMHHGALDAVVSRRMHHIRAEAAWLDELLADLTTRTEADT